MGSSTSWLREGGELDEVERVELAIRGCVAGVDGVVGGERLRQLLLGACRGERKVNVGRTAPEISA